MSHCCNMCPKEFASERAAEQHMDSKGHWGHPCETCDSVFSSERGAQDHMNAKNHWSRYGCETCNSTFSTENGAEHHMTAKCHWATRECETCGKDDFEREHSVVQHMLAQDHRQTPLASEMVPLGRGNKIFKDIETIFNAKWYHEDKTSDIESIFFNRRYAYLFDKMPSGWRRYFHGTKRACHVGSLDGSLELCNGPVCSLCRILDGGFKMTSAGSRGYSPMFGGGIYSTSVSSKADGYAMNHHIRSRLHGIILCLVFIGTFEKLHQADHWKTAPAEGCHSVMGATVNDGGTLQYTEAVVYRESSIIPIGLIMYTRTRR